MINYKFEDVPNTEKDIKLMTDNLAWELAANEKLVEITKSADPNDWRVLNSGISSPFYFEMRNLQSFPRLRATSSYLIQHMIVQSGTQFDHVVPVLMGGGALGYDVSNYLDKSVLTLRPGGNKAHGNKSDIVGAFKIGDKAIIIEDVTTSGDSILKACDQLRKKGLIVRDVFVLVNRGGQSIFKELARQGLTLYRVLDQQDILDKIPKNHPGHKIVMKYVKTK